MLDPTSPVDRRAALALQALGITADDLGAEGLDGLRARLAQDDGQRLVEILQTTRRHHTAPPTVPDDGPAQLDVSPGEIGQDA